MLDLACNGNNNISMLDIRGFILFHIYFIYEILSHLDSVDNRNPPAKVFYVFDLISKYGNQSKIHIFL